MPVAARAVHRFSLHSEKQDDDVLITDYFVIDGEVVPEEEFESFEIDDSAQEQFVRIFLLCARQGSLRVRAERRLGETDQL